MATTGEMQAKKGGYRNIDPEKAKATQFKPGQSGNPAGRPKGSKHLTTWIQELLEDEEFEATLQEGYKVVEYKGAPIRAIIRAQMIKALNGDTKAFDSLSRYGWSQKTENETTLRIVQPLMSLEENNALPGNDGDQEG